MDETLFSLIESLEKEKLSLAKKRVIEDIKLENKYNLLKEELKEINKKGLPYNIFEKSILNQINASIELYLIEYDCIIINIGLYIMKQLFQDSSKINNKKYNISSVKELIPIFRNKLEELQYENNIIIFLEYDDNEAVLVIKELNFDKLITQKNFFLEIPYKNMKIIF
tara:strand:- start:618 stop:1121 length:504 start_codon:yes stop_codon:yes gene_type:complete